VLGQLDGGSNNLTDDVFPQNRLRLSEEHRFDLQAPPGEVNPGVVEEQGAIRFNRHNPFFSS
jgi:hypothetical protein